MIRRVLLVALLALTVVAPVAGQEDGPRLPQQVFIARDINPAGEDRLTFLNILTGQPTAVVVNGERYSVSRDGVIFFDRAANRVKLVTPTGQIRDHPFIQPDGATRRIDWLVSANQRQIAWTLTTGAPNALTTTTTVAGVDGTNAEQVLVDGPRDGIRAMPVAFSPDGTRLYMDYQPDTLGDLTPFRDYAGLFQVDLTTGEVAMLPGEPGCFCGAALGAGIFVRLDVSDDLSGFDMRVHDFDQATTRVISALSLPGFTLAGDVLLAPDGRRAVYALAQISNLGRPDAAMRTVFVLADLTANTQSALTGPLTEFVRPVAWTDDSSAILLTSPTRDGTWKISLDEGRLNQIASATYLGMIE